MFEAANLNAFGSLYDTSFNVPSKPRAALEINRSVRRIERGQGLTNADVAVGGRPMAGAETGFFELIFEAVGALAGAEGSSE